MIVLLSLCSITPEKICCQKGNTNGQTTPDRRTTKKDDDFSITSILGPDGSGGHMGDNRPATATGSGTAATAGRRQTPDERPHGESCNLEKNKVQYTSYHPEDWY